ncbi:MAG: hypothetical protein IT370_03605 [Deltaproteobacteria bacterium]|nr:hypothetical protein [Deltaproteobacteria bacterium]
MKRRFAMAMLALLGLAACGGPQRAATQRRPPPVISKEFGLRFDVPAGWAIESVEVSDVRFLVRLAQGDLVMWVGAREGAEADPVAALRERGGTKATVKTSWMELPAAMTSAEASFSSDGGRQESRLLAVRGGCHYEMTLSAPKADAARARDLLLELRQQVTGLSGPTPLVERCNGAAAP